MKAAGGIPLPQDGRTPLFIAVQEGKAAVAKVLLYAGADGHVRDEEGTHLEECAFGPAHAEVQPPDRFFKRLKLSGNEVCCTACSSLVILKNSGCELYRQKVSI